MLQLEDRPAGSFRPPAPRPQQARLGLFRLLATLKRNPLECWSQEFFEEPIARVKLPFMQTFLVHDPAAIKQQNGCRFAENLSRPILNVSLLGA
jgi:hypothetical protein